jgi:hypothetical protein
MVNAGVVNGGSSYFSPPRFCESFADLGRILRLQNPFKYTRNFNINGSRGVFSRTHTDIAYIYQWFTLWLSRLTKQ